MIDPTAFQIVKQEVFRHPFKDDKVRAIAYAQGCFSAEQVAELMSAFNFDDDKMKGLQACVGKMLPAMCVATVPILRQFSFSKNQISTLELLAGHITDPLNYIVFDEVFSFISDRNKAREIMTRRAAMGGPARGPGVYTQASPGNPYPYGTPNYAVNPNDPVYRLVDKTANFVAGEVGALLGTRRNYGGAVLSRPVATTVMAPPGAQVLIQPQPGQTVMTAPVTAAYPVGAHPPPPPAAAAYPTGAQPPPPPGYHYPPGYYGAPQPPPPYK